MGWWIVTRGVRYGTFLPRSVSWTVDETKRTDTTRGTMETGSDLLLVEVEPRHLWPETSRRMDESSPNHRRLTCGGRHSNGGCEEGTGKRGARSTRVVMVHKI